jgi:predicted dehydrogenase
LSQLSIPTNLNYLPDTPSDFRPGIGIIGCGNIVRNAHLPAYEKHGLRVVGVHDISPEALAQVQGKYTVEHIFPDLDEMLSNPEIGIIDIATHPDQRIHLMRKALANGKHILAQKPLSLGITDASEVIKEAKQRGLKIAVNQNGRWAPAWRVATLLIEQGVIGDIVSITHLYDVNFGWVPGTGFDTIPHWAIYDYSVHWFDITRCWMGEHKVESVRARDYRTPNQPAHSTAEWGMWAEITYSNGANAMIRSIGASTANPAGHPFWIHGTEGIIRGSVLGNDYVELETRQGVYRYKLEGKWFPDGFAGTMGELMYAIRDNREAYNSAQHNLLSLQITLAACKSADEDGRPVKPEEIE